MKKIKLGIVGFGRMGITHFSILNTHQNVDIVSIADPSKLVLSLLKKYIGKIHIYQDYKEMLENESLDALIVCVPPSLHYNVISDASARGIHVFSEKPFTTKYTDALELTRKYEASGLVNQVGYVNRYNDVFRKAKEFLDSGLIGKAIRFKSEMFSCTVIRSDDSDGWRSTRNDGGGVVYEMASHAIDLVIYLIGKPDKILGSSLNKVYSNNVEDAVSSTFLYKNGISGTIYVNWSDASYRKPTNRIEVFGPKGKILADQHGLKIYLLKADEKHGLKEGWNTFYITDLFKPVKFYVRGNEFTRQLYDFIECIQNPEKKCLCTFKDGLNTSEIIESIFNDCLINSQI